MVAEDQTAGSPAEDPLPRSELFSDSAGSTGPSTAPRQATPGEMRPASSAADRTSSKVPIWDRLPRSIWLMSVLALCQ